MDRRDFIKFSALISATGSLSVQKLWSKTAILKKIGIQLFSLPKLLENDFRAGMKFLSDMGYREIEMYGPYPFSSQSAIVRWESVTPSLGFQGSGYFGKSMKEVKNILKEFKITAPSIHIDLDTLENAIEKVGEAAGILGHNYVGIPSIPPEERRNLDEYKKMADRFNRIGEKAKMAGFKFVYHNHGYGLQEMEGMIPLNLILDRTDPDLVFFEMDVYWTTAGGANPVDYLNAYPGRYRLLHIKDMKEKVRFSGDGGDPSQWIELFPYMTSAGEGVLDLPAIIDTAGKRGVEHFIVEQDMVSHPEIALKKSIDYLKGL